MEFIGNWILCQKPNIWKVTLQTSGFQLAKYQCKIIEYFDYERLYISNKNRNSRF